MGKELKITRRHPVECIPLTPHWNWHSVVTGEQQVRACKWNIDRIVPVQPQTCSAHTVAPRSTRRSRAVARWRHLRPTGKITISRICFGSVYKFGQLFSDPYTSIVYIPIPKFHDNQPTTFWVILLTNKQTNRVRNITSANPCMAKVKTYYSTGRTQCWRCIVYDWPMSREISATRYDETLDALRPRLQCPASRRRTCACQSCQQRPDSSHGILDQSRRV